MVGQSWMGEAGIAGARLGSPESTGTDSVLVGSLDPVSVRIGRQEELDPANGSLVYAEPCP